MLSVGVLPSRAENFVEDAFAVKGAKMQNQFTLDGADNNNYFTGIVAASNQVVKPRSTRSRNSSWRPTTTVQSSAVAAEPSCR